MIKSPIDIDHDLGVEEIYKQVLSYCQSDEERNYALNHKIRFPYLLKRILSVTKPGSRVANIGISIFDPYLKGVVETHSSSYYNIIPNFEFRDKLSNPFFKTLNTINYDVCSKSPNLQDDDPFDIVLFYETMEHLLVPDELVIKNISKVLKEKGVLLGSVPNALSLEQRIATMIGINTHWDKKNIIDGVFGGYGHIREYATYEVRKLLAAEFTNIKIYGYSPYGGRVKLYFLNILPYSMRSIVFFEATKFSSKSIV